MASPKSELTTAERLILRDLLEHGAQSRAGLSRRLGFSPASLSRITRGLFEHRLLINEEVRLLAATGRPSELIGLRGDAYYFCGVVILPDTLFWCVIDFGAAVVEAGQDADAGGDPNDVVAAIGRLVERLADASHKLTALGVILNGVVVTRGSTSVVNSSTLGWTDVPFSELLREKVDIPVTITNDVQAITAAQQWFGGGIGRSAFAVVSVDDEVRVGLMIRGEIVAGAHGAFGRADGLIVEAEPSTGRAPATAGEMVTASSVIGRLNWDAASTPSVDALQQRLREGDVEALAIASSAGVAVGRVIGMLHDLFDLEVVIVTGDGMAIYDNVWESVLEGVRTVCAAADRLEVIRDSLDSTELSRAAAATALRDLLRTSEPGATNDAASRVEKSDDNQKPRIA